MKPYRSMLFVPGHKPSWPDKALGSGADALILDLEDAVPPGQEAGARDTVRDTLARLGHGHTDLWVRPNPLDSGQMGSDLEAVVTPGLAGLFVPKVFGAEDVVRIDAVVSHLEQREGLEAGSIGLIVTLETASSMSCCEEIARAGPRVSSLLGATGPDGDIARELGYEFTPEGLETLYLRSRVVLACRAAGLHHPLGGVWQAIPDLDGLRRFADDNRRLGYRGMVLIHPSHVAVANAAFTPPPELIERYRRMVAAYRTAEAEGSSAVDFEGQHIDIAHVKTAEGVIALAEALG